MTVVVINAQTLGVSEYDLDAVDVVEGPGGVAWLALADGVAALGGVSQEAVDCRAQTGRLAFGDGQRHKACVEARFEGLAPGGAVVTTITGELGALVERQYQVRPTVGPDARARRVRLGRKVRGRTWALRVENVAGAELVLHQLAALPVAGRPAR
jgi:hypothetical protein